MENEQDDMNFREEVIEVECSQEGVDESEGEGSEEGMVDELMPQPAFHIEEDHQNLTEEEREAFSYIYSVRSQKQALLKDKPKSKVNDETKEIMKIPQNQSHQECEQIWLMLSEWKEESVGNWRLVIQNLQYLQKNTPREQYIKQKVTLQNAQEIPMPYTLCLNLSLNLSHIERYMVELSNLHYEKLQEQLDGVKVEQVHYHLWLYSLLALHQSYASYTNFQALASINAAMEKESQYYAQIKGKAEVTNQEIISWLINLLILIDVFKQTFLKKHLHIVRVFGLL